MDHHSIKYHLGQAFSMKRAMGYQYEGIKRLHLLSIMVQWKPSRKFEFNAGFMQHLVRPRGAGTLRFVSYDEIRMDCISEIHWCKLLF